MSKFLDRVSAFHWMHYEYQHDTLRGQPVPLWFNIITTVTATIMLVCGR